MAKFKLNHAIIGGYVPKDMFVNDAKTFCSFSVGIDDSYKDGNGNWVNNTDWINVKFWGKEDRIKRLAESIKAKTYVVVDGVIKQGSYKDKNGNTIPDVYVKASTFHPLGYLDGKNAAQVVGRAVENVSNGYEYTGGSAAYGGMSDDEIAGINMDFIEGLDTV